VEDTEGPSEVVDGAVELQETDRPLSVQTTRHNSRTNLRMYGNAMKLTRSLAFIASLMDQNERVGW